MNDQENRTFISYKEYWDEIYSLAKDPEFSLDRLEEHEWIIYSWSHRFIMLYTNNEDDIFELEADTDLSQEGSWIMVQRKFALFAMHADIRQSIGI